MVNDKRNIICAIVASLLAMAFFFGVYKYQSVHHKSKDEVTVGFIYDGDASVPYTANFISAASHMTIEYQDKVKLIEKHNVPYDDTENVLEELIDEGCDIIFTNSYGYGDAVKEMAKKYPDIQFCAATCDNSDPDVSNYHTFMGEIYQGRYVSGVVAGMKLNEMIQNGEITEDQAVMGYVAANDSAEVISGYTAFLLGARSQCPNTIMHVCYTGSWANYSLEKELTEKLIEEGCVIISHHTNTIGSAIVCENANMPYHVYHVGYNQDMMDVAPKASLISTRIDWSEYITSAVGAVIDNDDIENRVSGNIHGCDVSGGFKDGWVGLFEINPAAEPEGCTEVVNDTIKKLEQGSINVFEGELVGVDPNDPNDTYDLSTPYIENENASAPSFHYILKDVIIIDE